MYAHSLHITAPGQPSGRLQWRRSPLRSIAFGAAFGLALATPSRVQAEAFHCGAGDAPCLSAAITEANANGQKNKIFLDAGTYTLTAADNNTDGPNALPSITSRLEIDGAGPDTTFIEGQAGFFSGFRLIHVAATGDLTLCGLTLRGGSIGSIQFANRKGGGVFNHGGSVTIANAVLSGNNAGTLGGFGGGLYNADGMVTLTDSILTGNIADFGGGIANSAGGNVTIMRSTLANNLTHGAAGGIENFGTMTITDSLIDSNKSLDPAIGGGIRNVGMVTITNSILSRNGALRGGGGIMNGTSSISRDGGTVTITNSTVTGNGGEAGGIYNTGGTVTITSSTISLNGGSRVGGIFGATTITNSTVSGNQSGNFGLAVGGIMGGTITNSTVSGNSGRTSGGVAGVALQNTIVALNSSTVGAPIAQEWLPLVTISSATRPTAASLCSLVT
jgi:hypothetical protein